jgi:glycosyltransferase involved in cell wall biosynthesis
MANDGYNVVKELRRMNIDADLAINKTDFAMAFPEWEDATLKGPINPYDIKADEIRQDFHPPEWIKYFDFLNNTPRKKLRFQKTRARIGLLKLMREYDVIEAQVPYSIYAQFSGVPFVPYDAGWIRYFPHESGLRAKLAKRAHKNAPGIILTNPDTYALFEKEPYIDQNKLHFSPFAVDHEKYKPVDGHDIRETHLRCGEDFLLFAPSRHVWPEKGNDKMIRAYARFLKVYPNARFLMVDWTVDVHKSKALAQSLGIYHKIDWMAPVPKGELIRYYGAADIVLDQFIVGSWGTSTPEAMSCAKPVIMYYNPKHIMRAFGQLPPILNSFTEDEIYGNMVAMAQSPDKKEQVGNASRRWIQETHDGKKVALRHVEILEKCIRK